MRSDLWPQVDKLLAEALAQETTARRAFVAERAAGHIELEREVLSLLAADGEADTFLERPGEVLLGVGDPMAMPKTVAGQTIGAYRLLRTLGQGGMGTVYLAERDDEAYRQQVALKVLTAGPGDRELMVRFRTERQVLANLVHPNIARLYDGGTTDDGRPYLVMEYVEGEPIDAYCDHHRLSVAERLTLFGAVCDAVSFAHRNLVVHRDLKPGNILVGTDGAPRLLDFGIAKLLDAERFGVTAKVTRSGLRPMTPGFASPEQIRGEPITTATDVYALGVLLHRLLTGRGPYRRDKSLEHAILEMPPVRPSLAIDSERSTVDGDEPAVAIARSRRTTPRELRRTLRGDLDTLVLTALRKRPERRYGSAFALVEDLERYRRDLPLVARPDSIVYRLGKFVRRNTLAVIAGVAVALLLIGFSVVTRLQSVRIADERDAAQVEREKAQNVSDFLLQLFEAAAPEQARGQDVSISVVLERARESIAELEEPAVQAAATATLGRIYTELGRYDDARDLLEDAAEIQQAVFGDDSIDLAATLNNLGFVYLRKGDYDAAETAAREALAIRSEQAPDDLGVADSQNTLGLILHNQGEYGEAERLYRASLGITRERLGGEAAELLDTVGNLSILLHDLGDYQAAETMYRELLALRLRHSGRESPATGSVLGNLGVLLHDKGDWDEAEAIYAEAIDVRRQVLGDRHPALYRSVSNLARLRHDQGRWDEAETLYRQALEVHRAEMDERHPWVARTVRQLGRLALDRGDLETARRRYDEALAMQRERLKPGHRRIGETLVLLGHLAIVEGDHARASSALAEADTILQQRLAPGHWQQRHLAALRALNDDGPTARATARQTRDALASAIGADAPPVRDLDTLLERPPR